jgi:long-subunit fatty acid transport protein
MKIQLSTLFLLLFGATLFAQPKQNSPYSRYGLGDPIHQFFAAQAGIGGQTAAFHDPFHLNLVNPASYAFLRATTFEGGMFAKRSNYQASSESLENWSGNLAYLAIGFPLRSPINEVLDRRKSDWHFGMGAALTPNSVVGYNIASFDTLPDLGALENSFEGNGGTYRFTWSNAVKYKKTAFGLNLGWIFGKNSYENTTLFSDTLPTFRSTRRDDIRISGLTWSVGAQHDFVLKYAENDKTTATRWVTVGLTGEGQNNIRSTGDRIFIRHRQRNSAGQYESADTLLLETDTKRTITLPATLRVGAQYVVANKLRVGVQYAYEGWSVFKNEARTNDSGFRNASSVSAGAEYIPDHLSYNRYAKRIRYRAGAYYRQDPRVINGKGLDDIGVSLGLGFPIILPRQQTSFINTAIEIGRLGADSPVQETYFRLTAGFTFNDNSWFYKRRFE